MPGLYFEEFYVGQEFHHAFSPTVAEMDNTMFSLLTIDSQPLHVDAHFSEKAECESAPSRDSGPGSVNAADIKQQTGSLAGSGSALVGTPRVR